MHYRGFELDDFQQQAITAIRDGRSVLVSAPTGAGKTLIADYAVEQALKQGSRCIYTSPLKALSNQKYRDFVAMLGVEKVGIMTGDVVIRIDAPLLIMTTEVLRNILHRDPGRVAQVEFVIFDELHFLANIDRGTVWEECLILLPQRIRIIGLSATVNNVDELARWLSEIKHTEIMHVVHMQRPVPLKILGFTRETKLKDNETIEKYRLKRLRELEKRGTTLPPANDQDRYRSRRNNPLSAIFKETTHRDLIRAIAPDYLPCLYFVFSRVGCEHNAMDLDMDLTTAEEKAVITRLVEPVLESHGTYEQTQRLAGLLVNGIGYHHAGLFPFLKDLVETLYEMRMIKVLYCTSTFALGVNMPARTAVFDRLLKFDGTRIRPLTALEFFQKAGRAGRRGMDAEGYVIINRNLRQDAGWIPYDEKDIEPIISALNLSYNSIINLLEKYTLDEIKQLLGDSLWTFQHRNQIEQHEEFAQVILADLSDKKGLKLNQDPSTLDKRKVALDAEATRLEQQRTALKNSQVAARGRKHEIKLFQELERLERKIKDIRDQRKNIEVMGFVIDGDGQNRPGKRINKLFSKVRRAQEKVLYYRDYLFNLFQAKMQVLIDLSIIDENLALLSRAEICKYLYIQELFVTRLISDGIIDNLDELTLCALLNCIGQEERRRDFRRKKEISHPFEARLLKAIRGIHQELRDVGADRFDPIEFNLQYAYVAWFWAKGYEFSQLSQLADLQEGDIISSFRQTIDLLKQLKDVYRADQAMIRKLNHCIDCMDRDVVKVII